MACYHHSSKQASAQCNECKKGICKSCYDTYSGICYDCAEKAANESLYKAMDFKESVVKARKGMITGSIVGGVIGLVAGIGGTAMNSAAGMGTGALEAIAAIILGPILGLCIGGSLVTSIKAVYGTINSFFKEDGSGCLVAFFVIGSAIVPIMGISPIVTIIRFFRQKNQMEKADVMIEECENNLVKLRDYHKLSMAV
jgi:hypothetical protein